MALKVHHEHLQHCVVRAAEEGGDETEAKLQEASEAIARLAGPDPPSVSAHEEVDP